MSSAVYVVESKSLVGAREAKSGELGETANEQDVLASAFRTFASDYYQRVDSNATENQYSTKDIIGLFGIP